jgi:hypothetical protein
MGLAKTTPGSGQAPDMGLAKPTTWVWVWLDLGVGLACIKQLGFFFFFFHFDLVLLFSVLFFAFFLN